MQEYWVNVYGLDEHKAYGAYHDNLLNANFGLAAAGIGEAAYRIHVKMDGGYNKKRK